MIFIRFVIQRHNIYPLSTWEGITSLVRYERDSAIHVPVICVEVTSYQAIVIYILFYSDSTNKRQPHSEFLLIKFEFDHV